MTGRPSTADTARPGRPPAAPTDAHLLPSDTFVAKRIGTSVFCSVEGRLVCLHIKSDHTFLVTVTQEPLIVHVGSFRFRSLLAGSGARQSDSASVGASSVAAFAKSFIEAFEAAAARDVSTLSPASFSKRSATVAFGEQKSLVDEIGVELLLNGTTAASQPLTSTAFDSSAAGSPAASDVARRSSWVALHREKMDAEVRDLSSRAADIDTEPGSPARTLKTEEELLREATANQTLAVRVKFVVFGVLHGVALELKPCPAQPHIREPIVWGIFMDMMRTVVSQRRQIEHLQQHQSTNIMPLHSPRSTVAKQPAADSAETRRCSPRNVAHSRKTTVSKTFHGTAAAPPSAPVVSTLPQPCPSITPIRPKMSPFQRPQAHSGDPPEDAPDVLSDLADCGTATSARLPAASSHCNSPQRSHQQAQPPWQYNSKQSATSTSQLRAQLMLSTTRPTSASTDFAFRLKYAEDVLLRAGVAPVSQPSEAGMLCSSVDEQQQVLLALHPNAPKSAAQIRGTYSARAVQPMSTVVLGQ